MLERSPRPSGSSLKPVIIIVAALLISAAVFFLFTKKRLNPKAPVVAEAVEAPISSQANADAPAGAPGTTRATATPSCATEARNDLWLRPSARPRHPGVAQSGHG